MAGRLQAGWLAAWLRWLGGPGPEARPGERVGDSWAQSQANTSHFPLEELNFWRGVFFQGVPAESF